MCSRLASKSAGRMSEYRSDYSNADIQVSATLLKRIRCQKGKNELDLSLTKITRVPLDAIKNNYGDVTTMDLSYNTICLLPSKFVAEMSSLTRLDLGRNHLRKLPDEFGALTQLVYLDVRTNQLKTLPVSMGKMTRLVFLNLENNPFLPPLSSFLQSQQLRTNGEFSASAVVSFLAKVDHDQETLACGDYKSYSQSEVEEDEDEDITMSTNYMDKENNNAYKSLKHSSHHHHHHHSGDSILSTFAATSSRQMTSPSEKRDFRKHLDWVLYKVFGVSIFLLLVLMIPLMTSLFYETSAMDHLVKGNVPLEWIWEVAKPLHETSESILNYLQLSRAFVLKGPKEPEELNHFMAMFVALRDALTDLLYVAADMLAPLFYY